LKGSLSNTQQTNLINSLPDSVRSALLDKFQRERQKRLLQSNLVRFTEFSFQIRDEEFIENSHHHQIAEALEKLKIGELYQDGRKCNNLLINIPPRYGKTEMMDNWIAQCLAENAKCKFILLSYSDDLALDNSSKIKELILSPEYQEYWPLKLKDDSQSKKKWYTQQGGGVYATAAGGAITGFGAGSTAEEGFCGAIIIDDPLKVDDADRDGERNRVNRRLNTTIKSRRNSRHTPIIIIMQRLHEEDMSGFVLNDGMGESFYHLKIPAIQPDGTALWPFKHTIEELEKQRAADPRTFSGQMQQEPSPDDGTFFKRDWFKRFRPGGEPQVYKFGASDYAVTEPEIGQKPDWTEHGIAGFDEHEDLWFLDWWSGQTAPDTWIDEQLNLGRRHEPFVWVGAKGVIRNAVEPFLKREMKAQNVYINLEWLPEVKNKGANARSFQALASAGKVHIPNTPWGDDLINQLLKFLNGGRYDDKVDVCSMFGRMLHEAFGPRALIEEEKKQSDAYGNSDYDDDNEDSWKTA
jgi:predicted phage terminase large subunit-like protein